MDRIRAKQRRNFRRIAGIRPRLLQRLTRARRAVYVKRAIEHSGETLYEELANAVVAGVATVLAAGGLALLVVLAASTESAKAVTSVAIYGATLFLAFLFSSLYHGIWHRSTKRIMLVLDHISIFLLIAGTYTPITLIVLPQPLGWTLFGILWGLAALGIAVRLWAGELTWVQIPIFLAMGWIGFAWGGTIFEYLGSSGTWLLLAGGFAYSGGVVFYLWRSLRFNHAVWHGCVLGGAVCHFVAVAVFALPAAAKGF